jgi:hypothetical protein
MSLPFRRKSVVAFALLMGKSHQQQDRAAKIIFILMALFRASLLAPESEGLN